MPVGIFTNSWYVNLLKALATNTPAAQQVVLRLFVNNYTPLVTDTGAEYVECTLAGYTSQPLPSLAWTISATGGIGLAQAPPVLWTFSAYAGPQVTLYGVYYTGWTGLTALQAAQRFDAPYAVPLAGGSFTLYPVFTDRRFGS